MLFLKSKEFERSLQIINDLIPIIEADNKLLTDLYDSKGDIYTRRNSIWRISQQNQISIRKMELNKQIKIY